MTSILAIDTASERFAVAWLDEAVGEPRVVEGEGARDHSRQLLDAIREVAGSDLASLRAVLVTTGPGSYAGLRVGIATAEGLALARGAPVYGVGTLEAAAAAAPHDGARTIVHPIGRGEFATQEWASGKATAEIRVVAGGELTGDRLTGEGAGALGGFEIGPRERVLAVFGPGRDAIAAKAASGVEAFYIREPHITRPRRATMAPGT
ncbi:MAG TPA: tRNA (adenosine(37)-N6)-threonylcarbamoyltransferase complex dimerization subunit type 1 TsaB [Tepidiformaceae bacterium]|nr:tRNA (adenosine(37)-N6)-threonylcarbamoyltransferase complex dimerization subunit type 1 TsaB [Tepidiformaceae bacterium]